MFTKIPTITGPGNPCQTPVKYSDSVRLSKGKVWRDKETLDNFFSHGEERTWRRKVPDVTPTKQNSQESSTSPHFTLDTETRKSGDVTPPTLSGRDPSLRLTETEYKVET